MLPNKSSNKNYRKYLSLGTEITSGMLVPLAVGYLVDYYYGTEPWGFLGGMIVGFLVVFNMIYRIALNAKSSNKTDKRNDE